MAAQDRFYQYFYITNAPLGIKLQSPIPHFDSQHVSHTATDANTNQGQTPGEGNRARIYNSVTYVIIGTQTRYSAFLISSSTMRYNWASFSLWRISGRRDKHGEI